MNIYDKIRARRIELSMSQEELAIKSGYKDRSSIAKIESGLVDLSISKVDELAKILEVSPSYLMGWEENKTNHTSDYSTSNLTNIKDLNIVPIPHITNFVACCGNGIDFECLEDTTETIYLPTELVGYSSSNKWVMHTTGDSMNKIIPENSHIIVERNLCGTYSNGDIVLYKLADNYTIKEYYLFNDRITLKPSSYNPLHEQEVYYFDDRDNGFEWPEIIGKVISFYGSV